jgi:ribosomal protein L32
MKDQTEFEIELYNPTKEKIMAMIEMNGTPISGSGIILKPGQRVFLERFLDEEKKFLYETYVVDNNKETKEAIQDNGKVMVKFHRESKPRQRGLNYGTIFNGSSGFGWSEVIYTDYSNSNPVITHNTNDIIGTSNNFFTNSVVNTSISNKNVETGSVEKGGQSNQELRSTNGDFEWFYTWIDDWQIMPHTHQPKTSKDLVSRCPSCANKLKSTHKFCPDCGSEITGKALLEDVLQKLPKEDLIKMILGIK